MRKAALATEPTTTKGGTTKKVSFKGALKKTVARNFKTTNAPSKYSIVKELTTKSSKGKAKAVSVTRKKLRLRFADVDEIS